MSIACYIVAIVKRITRTTSFTKRPYELNNLGFEDIITELPDFSDYSEDMHKT